MLSVEFSPVECAGETPDVGQMLTSTKPGTDHAPASAHSASPAAPSISRATFLRRG